MIQSRLLALPAMVAVLLGGCLAETPADSPGARVSVAVAPLDLAGVTDVVYTLRVMNGAAIVWERTDLRSTAYGDGSGALSYVGTCDASAADNRVELEISAIEADGAPLVAGVDYLNPAPVGDPVFRTFPCVADADTAVDFDLTVARRAEQGFFDVAVSFSNVFCSAKLDCVDEDGQPLELLFDGPERGPTAVVALACSGGPGADTHLYMNDLVLDCAGADTTVDPSLGPGNLSAVAGSGIPDAHLFEAQVTRTAQAVAGYDVRYWTVALGLDDVTGCTLTASATASDGALEGGATPDGGVYPYIAWQGPLTGCGHHALDSGDGVVETRYAGPTPLPFAHSDPAAIPAAPTLAGSGTGADPFRWDDGAAASCDDYLHPDASHDPSTEGSGVYRVDPDGPGGDDPFPVYCDMTTVGGGWTLVWKQSSFTANATADNASLRGSALLLDEVFSGSTNGSIIGSVAGADTGGGYTEVLFKASALTWVHVPERIDSWPVAFGNRRCRDLGLTTPTCSGVDCGTYEHIAFYSPAVSSVSSFTIGTFASGYGGECGEVWCSGSRHGRYNGGCQNNSKGVGDWMLFVR